MNEITITIKFIETEDNSIEAYNLEQLQEMYRPHQHRFKNKILREAKEHLEKVLKANKTR